MTDLWNYRPDLKSTDVDVVGFDVEATDGHIGAIDEASDALDDAYLVVDTGFWIFGKKRVIPARAVKQINVGDEKVFLDMTKDQVKGAPDHHADWGHPDHRDAMAGYYVPFIL
ncbi:MAG: PRC-barrel domain containing protein [Ilumatobacter sp.]|nr:PRC-barrel domain containing protein [Ilumatobacter sp.]